MVRSRVKLSLIPDKTARKTTFKKRKGGIMKKLNELVTLCGVKACAVIYNGPNDANPEAWPSRGGAEEVISRFLDFPDVEREKKMYDQKSYTNERILKEEATLTRLQEENREFLLKEIMFDLLKGNKMMEHHSRDASLVHDLCSFIDYYVNDLNKRIHMLQANGEPFSFPSLDVDVVDSAAHPDVEDDVNPIADADVADVTTMPLGLFDHIQNMNMNQHQAPAYLNDHVRNMNMNQQAPPYLNDHVQNMNMNQQAPPYLNDHVPNMNMNQQAPPYLNNHVQNMNMNQQAPPYRNDHIQNMNMNQQAPAYLNDHIPYQNMNQQESAQYQQVPTYFPDHVQYQNMNHQDQFQYQAPDNVYNQNQYGLYGLNQGMGLDLNNNMSESFNQYPNLHHQPLMNQWMAQPQQRSYAEELASVPSMDNNYYNYHQQPSTSYMPSMDLSALNTNNWPTRFGFE